MSILLLATAVLLQKLPLLDQGPEQPQFAKFRASLLAACDKPNPKWIESRISPGVKSSFGESGGKSAMLKAWRNSDGGMKAFYRELKSVLRLGGGFREGSFWAPSVYAFWPEKIDAYEHVVAIGAAVPVFDSPDEGHKMIATLSWDIVKLLPNPQSRTVGMGYTPVEINGQSGWVKKELVRSSVDYRACFTKIHGSWMLTAFVSGD